MAQVCSDLSGAARLRLHRQREERPHRPARYPAPAERSAGRAAGTSLLCRHHPPNRKSDYRPYRPRLRPPQGVWQQGADHALAFDHQP